MLSAVFDDDTVALRPTTAYVSRSALRANVAAVRERVGERQIMAVVKANAYGHGLVRAAQTLLDAGVNALGVAFLEEGIMLRRAEIRAPILVLGGLIGNQIVHFLEHDLMITASSPFKLQQIEEAAAATGKRAKVHLKIDTGMERIGIHWDTAERLLEAAIRVKHSDVEGVFTHLATADAADDAYVRTQLARFDEVLDFFPRRGVPTPTRHAANSGAILQHDAALYDLVRPGIMLYGVYPSRTVRRSVTLVPALSLETRVVYFKVVRAGSPVSYDGTWVAPRDTRVVTLPVGYGDGYARGLSDRAEVLIGGARRPIVGRITMDALMVDLGEGTAYNGDEAVLLGAQGGERISVEELADHLGTIPYEVLTMINTRVPREYIE